MTVFGFNTDVKVGDTVFHVQTEDRGVTHPILDTTIYVRGRVLAKRGTSYQDFLASPDFSEAALHAMLEDQHRRILEEVRAGTLPELAQAGAETEKRGIRVQLLNPGSFLKETTATMELSVQGSQDGEAIAGASVRLWLHTGTPQPFEFEGTTDTEGRVTLQFHMPRLGPAGAHLQIQASSPAGRDEVKYTVRPRPKA